MKTDYLQLILLIAILGLLIRQQIAKTKVRKTKKRTETILDTCALIDGRILGLVSNGFMNEPLVIPQFVVAELQHLADGSDAHKRERARYGLDVVRELQANPALTVIVDTNDFPAIKQVDDKLVALAQKRHARLYTTDYNLNKVADIKGVTVLNINELAQQLRPLALPGEVKTITIVQKGSNRNQGVGYLDDGTMVVVDGAARSIGKSVTAEVTRIHQTVAGKMIFAEIKPVSKPAAKSR